MAVRYAVASGNWSSLATWDGGVALPTVGDEVHANGFTVTINQDINVLHISTRANGAAAAGGTFQVTATGRNLTCAVQSGTGTLTLSITGANNTFILNGNIEGSLTSAVAALRFSTTGTSNITINGNVTAGTFGGSVGVGMSSSPTGTLTVNGNVIGGGNGTTAVQISSVNLAAVINGDVTAGAATSGSGINLDACISCTISGSVSGSVSGAGIGVNQTSTSTGLLTIGGNVNSYAGAGITFGALGRSVVILGDVISNGAASAITSIHNNTTVTTRDVIRIGSAVTISLTGQNSKLIFRIAIQDPTATVQQYVATITQFTNSWSIGEGLNYGVDGMNPINGRVYFKDLTTASLTMPLELGGTTALGREDGLDWGDTALFPDEDDVRFGVVYASANKTGNATFPSPSLVADGTGYGANGVEYEGTLAVAIVAPLDLIDNLTIINDGVKKASLLVPHTTDLVV